MRKKGSLTVEAAMVMPMFLFLLLNLISVFEMLQVYLVMEAALQETAREMAGYAYILEIKEEVFPENAGEEIADTKKTENTVASEAAVTDADEEKLMEKATSMLLSYGYAGPKTISEAKEAYPVDSMIAGGSLGVTLWRSSVLEENEDIDLVVTYRVKPRFNLFGLKGMKMVHRCCIRAFTGFDPAREKEKEKVYYVTADSEVYHVFRDCSHLKLTIQSVPYGKLDSYRSEDGSRYRRCEYCMEEDMVIAGNVYIAPVGECFHQSLNCPGLKRTVYVISQEETGSRRACKRCSKSGGS